MRVLRYALTFILRWTRALRCIGFHSQFTHQLQHLRAFPFGKTPPFELAWQYDRTKTHTNQATHGQADGFKHTTHLAVTSFGNHHTQPTVRTFATQMLNDGEAGQTIFQLNTIFQLMQLCIGDLAQHAHGVFTLVAVTRVHHAVGNITRSGQDQQTFGIKIQSPYRQPFAFSGKRQAVKHGRTAFRIAVADDFARRFVINHDTRYGWCEFFALQQFAVNTDLIVIANTLPNMCGHAVDRYAAGDNQFLHIAA